jgi:hypothetical protein
MVDKAQARPSNLSAEGIDDAGNAFVDVQVRVRVAHFDARPVGCHKDGRAIRMGVVATGPK